jgi:RimJ/RimL family protein N-acetyltransferase
MTGMTQWWPLTALRLQTPRLELRLPGEADLDALAALAAAGVHDPAVQPFETAWTDVTPPERARSVLQFHWSQRAAWTPQQWALQLVVVRDETVVGTQGISGHDFALLREVSTGSWLGLGHQRQGIGTEMRAAVLHLAFAGLGAQYAVSSANSDNAASLGVSRKLGYALNVRLRLDRQTWAARAVVPVRIAGLDPCLPMFGLTGGAERQGDVRA